VVQATTKTQDLRRRGGEETEDSHPVTPKPGMPGTPDWREENNFNTKKPEKKKIT